MHAPVATTWSRVLRELAFALAAALAYFLVRGLTESSAAEAIANAHDLVAFEKALGIYTERAIQEWYLRIPGGATLANWVYIWGHWPVIAVVALWLIRKHPRTYWQLREAFLISGGIGIVIFALYPVAPPRLADLDLVDTVTQQSNAYRVLQPPAFTNQYAAMPSLHFGWNLLIGIALVRESRWLPLRVFGVLLPIAMAIAVVVTANHFIIDAVAGGALALFALWITTWPSFDEIRLRAARFYAGLPGRGPGRRSEGPVKLVAHRAGNHPARLREAVEAGAPIVEADVWHRGGRLEVRHSKTMGPVPLRWDRWSLEGAWVRPMLLVDLVRGVGGDATLMLDLKGGSPALATGVIEVMRTHAPGRPYVVSSQWWKSLEPFRDVPEATVLHSIGSERMLRRLEATEDSFDGIAVHRRLLTRPEAARLRDRAGIVASWPINTEKQLEEVTDWGVDWAISDTLWQPGRDGRSA